MKFALLLIGITIVSLEWGKGEASAGSYSFEIHHRFSERVKKVIGGDGLPEKESLDYYKALVDRDRMVRGRRLATDNNHSTLAFSGGSSTEQISFLHYANVTVGTPPQWFLVALDTGSDLFWLPCDCSTSCVRRLETDDGKFVDVNIYDPSKSRSSAKVGCNNTLCPSRNACFSPSSECRYIVRYLSENTETSGVLVDDILHLTTEDSTSQPVEAPITLGCSKVQEGLFREAAVNGLMGLGREDIGVPSMLAKAGVLPSDSFSMCFNFDGYGTLSFGDNGSSSHQQLTPLNPTPFPYYNVTITEMEVGNTKVDAEFTAIFDSGTAVTWLLQPYYNALTQNFHRSVTDRRIPSGSGNPFDFCYLITSRSDPENVPSIDFKMQGGAVFHVMNPIMVFSTSNGGSAYCLAVIKQDDSSFSIIGQNFMTNYRVVHDRERMVLGWTESNCNEERGSSGPMNSPPSQRSNFPRAFDSPSTGSSSSGLNGPFTLLNPSASTLLLSLPLLLFLRLP